jgi:hypothetical protein
VKEVSLPIKAAQSSLPSHIMMLWLVGTVIFLPVKIINLPFNFELVDIWILMGLPVVLLFYVIKPRQIISLSYIVPIWLVLVSSFLSSFTAPSVTNSLTVIFKETYLFVWFLSLTVLLIKLNARDLRIVMFIWSIVVILHGLLIVAQFLSPELWSLTNSLGGNLARAEGYRPAGLFICDQAGCANKAAYFQLLGFVPILLAGFSKRTTIILGITLLVSLLTTGSMSATLAFCCGLIVVLFSISYINKSGLLIIKYLIRIVIAILLLGGLFYVVTSQNQGYQDHFEKIIVGRFDRSSSGRINLWQRGVDVLLENNAYFWGVGPDNFRVVDTAQTDNQLHNDTLAFLVERGLIGVAGLALFAGIAIRRAITILQLARKDPKHARLELVVFLAVIVATIVVSLTHQLFRTRELWLVIALQEAVYFKMMTSKNELERTIPVLKIPPGYYREALVNSDAIVDG